MTKTEKQSEAQAEPKLDDSKIMAAFDQMNAGEVEFPYTLDLP